jgi:hypothetical protein
MDPTEQGVADGPPTDIEQNVDDRQCVEFLHGHAPDDNVARDDPHRARE